MIINKRKSVMVLKIEHLTGGYSKTPVIHDVSLDIKKGEIVGLIGLNGAGKSTTIKHILGLLMPHSGEIRVDGITISEDAENYRRDRKSTRLNSSHVASSYAVFCLQK